MEEQMFYLCNEVAQLRAANEMQQQQLRLLQREKRKQRQTEQKEQWMRQHQQSKGPMSDILAEMPDVAPEVVKKAVREMLEMPRPSGFVLNQN